VPRPAHDPVERLNRHHADDVLAVARTFGGRPDATAARVVALDATGLELAIEAPSGTTTVRVAFDPTAAGGTSPRLRFRALAGRARGLGD
jgi:hypothetical protein